MTDKELLADYAAQSSERAFAELVRRHIDLVYSAALRMVRDPHAAQDVTQAVFLLLAQRARDLTNRLALEGWLHCTARNLAVKLVRSEVRRRTREQKAVAMEQLLSTNPDPGWEEIAPHLDDAIDALAEPERDALLLRYFKNLDLRTVGATLGISEDAAQKRVSRAVAKLRESLAAQGVSVGVSGLALSISANAVHATPAGLTALIPAAATLAGTATTTSVATQSTMSWITAKSVTAMIASALIGGTLTYWVKNSETDRLHSQNQKLLLQQTELIEERDAALTGATATDDELNRLRSNESELLRLRGEVGQLRGSQSEVEKLQAENRQLRTALASAPPPQMDPGFPSGQEQVKEHLGTARNYALAMIMYAVDNEQRLPENLEALSQYVSEEIRTNFSQFEIVCQGNLTNISAPASTLLLRQKEPVLRNGKWTKVYGFADGHTEAREEPPEGFAAWEENHMVIPDAAQGSAGF